MSGFRIIIPEMRVHVKSRRAKSARRAKFNMPARANPPASRQHRGRERKREGPAADFCPCPPAFAPAIFSQVLPVSPFSCAPRADRRIHAPRRGVLLFAGRRMERSRGQYEVPLSHPPPCRMRKHGAQSASAFPERAPPPCDIWHRSCPGGPEVCLRARRPIACARADTGRMPSTIKLLPASPRPRRCAARAAHFAGLDRRACARRADAKRVATQRSPPARKQAARARVSWTRPQKRSIWRIASGADGFAQTNAAPEGAACERERRL